MGCASAKSAGDPYKAPSQKPAEKEEPKEEVQPPQPRAPSNIPTGPAKSGAGTPATPPQFVNGGAKSDAGSSNSAPADSDELGGDDLGWASAPAKADEAAAPPAWAVAAVGGSSSSDAAGARAGAGSTPADLGVTVQINLEGGWREMSAEEVLQICQSMAKGKREFQIQARGQAYQIALDGPDGAVQINTRTGKRRKMRILEKDGDDMPPDPPELDRGMSAEGIGKRTLPPELMIQQEYGPQSKRGGASQHPMKVLAENPHAQECFKFFELNEAKLCGEWAVFYHSYSFAALIYEVHAAVGAVLFRFRSQFATLPRILVHEFNQTPDAKSLRLKFDTKFANNKRDHHPEFRSVGLSVMCSLVSTGPEACVPMVFVAGYSCKDMSFRGVLEGVLESCYVPKSKVKKLADDIIELSEKHGLDVSQFGGKPCKSGKAGHLLQIFMKRNLVDTLCYPAKPYGVYDKDREPLSRWMDSNESVQVGQARIVAHPKYFLKANCIRCHVASADPDFHRNRQEFQKQLTSLLNVILGEPKLREKAATGIYGGKLPSWFSSEDQSKLK